uniref:Uncharacterized protein n=1 Tax=Oryzias sinensis TaxID=183150 RepID=A0A8C7XHP8_9TELE
SECGGCCPDVSLCENCLRLAEMCNCHLPAVGSFLPNPCLSPNVSDQSAVCVNLDCACTCQPPECESCNCLCFEIRIK